MPRKHRITLPLLAILAAAALLLGIPAWYYLVRPIATYLDYNSSITGGERYGYLMTLANQGPLGACLTRHAALSSLDQWAIHGHHHILYTRQLWIGRTRAQLRADFGPPDESTPGLDIWHVGQKDVLRQKFRDPNLAWDDLTARQWAITLAAEYENDRLVRFGNPDTSIQYLEPIQNSPYQLHYQAPVDLDHLTTHPPKAWPTPP